MLQWPLANGTAQSSSSKGCSADQREKETHFHTTRKNVISFPVRQGREINQPSLGCSLGQTFTGTEGLPSFYTSSPSLQKWPTLSSTLAESTSWHKACNGWVPPPAAQNSSFLERGLAGDSTTKQGTKHVTPHVMVHDHRLNPPGIQSFK